MDRDTMMKFKKLFETQKQMLIYSSSIVNEDFQIQADDYIDEIDTTSSELETSMRLRLRSREAFFLKKLQDALNRISTGRFGKCEDCGDNIEMGRLEARPTATFCLGCKEERERTELLHIGGRRPKSLGVKLKLA